MKKVVGVFGLDGRMGQNLRSVIDASDDFALGFSICGKSDLSEANAEKVFDESDCVIEFSSCTAIEPIISSCFKRPKPLLLCSTGWKVSDLSHDLHSKLMRISEQVPVIISPNTSIGASIQSNISRKIAQYISKLDVRYDIDIIDKHHRNKKDKVSGTAIMLQNSVIDGIRGEQYPLHNENRAKSIGNAEVGVNIASIRAGNIHGEHEVTFTSDFESISVKHTAFDRKIFAIGACNIMKYVLNNSNEVCGIYTGEDIISMMMSMTSEKL